MIVKGTKDEAPLLDRCLENVSQHVDAIYLNINTPKGVKVNSDITVVAKKYKANYIITEWTGNFVNARNENFAQVPEEYDFIIWLDTDDTVDKPEEIRKIIAVLSKNTHGIYINYDYDHDELGNTTVSHYVARIVRNDATYTWKSSVLDDNVAVHETLNEVTPRGKAMCNDFKIIHHADNDRKGASLIRNTALLEGMYERQKEANKYDPRTLFYLATHYYDAGNFEDAVSLLRDYLSLSGWAEERCEAHVYLGNIYRIYNDKEHAYEEYIRAMGEFQNSPRPYVELSSLSYEMKRYQDSADWAEKALKLPKPTTTMVLRPMEATYNAHMLVAQAYANIGGSKLNSAKKHIESALKLRPTDKDAQNARDLIDNMIENRDDIKATARLIKRFINDKNESKIIPFLDALPYDVQDNPLVLNTRHTYTPPKKWGKKTMAIYVGQGPLGIWGPWSLKKGIGGSEEAVVQISRQLASLGWEVVVYATPGENAGKDVAPYMMENGVKPVEWKQYYEFNPNDEYNVLVIWRTPAFFDADIKAKKKYLWLHDVMPREDFLPDRVAKMDKVIFVGKYHASLYEGVIPKEKMLISGNGIEPKDFEKYEKDGEWIARVPHRIIYQSSYNRGLRILLDNWDRIKKEVPDAELRIAYGWQSFDALCSDNPERMAWKNDMIKLMNKCDGVVELGRIGHDEIIEEIFSADVMAYPCTFPEVYCISYVKALAGGANVVSTDFAELVNYKKTGATQVHYDEKNIQQMIDDFISALIYGLKNPPSDRERQKRAIDARNRYSWANTAKGWDEEMR